MLGACARNIWLLTAMYNVSIDFTHILGVQNSVADLSRWKYDAASMNTLYELIPDPVWMNTHIDLTLLNYDGHCSPAPLGGFPKIVDCI